MVWVKMGDRIPHERRHRLLDGDSNWMLFCLLAYTNREATDGRIDLSDLDMVWPGARPEVRDCALANLATVGAITRDEAALQVVWHLDEQPTAEEITESRIAAAARAAAYRRRQKRISNPAQLNMGPEYVTPHVTHDVPSHVRTPDPTRPDPTRSGSGSDPSDRSGGGAGTHKRQRASGNGAVAPPPDLAAQFVNAWQQRTGQSLDVGAFAAAVLQCQEVAIFDAAVQAFVTSCEQRGKKPQLRWLITQIHEWARPAFEARAARERARQAHVATEREMRSAEREHYEPAPPGTLAKLRQRTNGVVE